MKLALEVSPEVPETRAEIGRAMLRFGMVDDALKHLKTALRLADKQHGRGWPGKAAVLHAVGHAHAVNSDLDKAIAAFRGALALEPLSASPEQRPGGGRWVWWDFTETKRTRIKTKQSS